MPTAPVAGIIIGTVSWLATHAWCHKRCLSLRAGDAQALGTAEVPDGFAEALGRGISLGTVSTEHAIAAHARGLISDGQAAPALTGAYRRRYDRTLASDSAWLPAHIASSLLGAAVSPVAAALLATCAACAQTDARFRVIPTAAAALMAMLAPFAVPAGPTAVPFMRAAALAVSLAAFALIGAAARERGRAFGGGDAFLLACPLAATLMTPGLVAFPVALALALATRFALSRWAGRPRDIPLGAYTLIPTAIAIALA